MMKFLQHDPKALARQTPVAEITDEQVWNMLVTPVVKALLGPFRSSDGPRLRDDAALEIPEDTVFNLNGHVIDGKTDKARYPYFHTVYRFKRGKLIIRRDGIKLEVFAAYGDARAKQHQLIWKVALRDRRYDGTKEADDCALEHFPYSDAKLNGNFFPEAKTVELYLFCYSPGSTVSGACGDKELEAFDANPYKFADRPELFLKLFARAWDSERAPGQWAEPIQDAADLMEENFTQLCQTMGYDIMEVAASHFHVAKWCEASGYRYTIPDQDKNMADLTAGIARVKAAGAKLTRRQESWITALQSLPQKHIPQEYNLGGAKWQQDNITLPNLWLWKPLNDKARAMKPTLYS
jgi:hypothetical protein